MNTFLILDQCVSPEKYFAQGPLTALISRSINIVPSHTVLHPLPFWQKQFTQGVVKITSL